MAESSTPLLKYSVQENVPGTPNRGQLGPTTTGPVTSYFNGSPPTLETGFHAISNETLDTYSSSDSLVLLPRWAGQEPMQRSGQLYGSINHEQTLQHVAGGFTIRRVCFKILKIVCISILFTTVLFYATGHGYKIYMGLNISELVSVVSQYKYYIMAAYIGIVLIGFAICWCVQLFLQNINQESPLLTRSWSMSLVELNREFVE